MLPTGHQPGPRGSHTPSGLSPLPMQSHGHLAEGSGGAGGGGRARRQLMWPSSGGVSDRLAKPPKPPDHRLSLHGGFRVQPGARPGQRGRRVPPPLPLPSASLWAPGGGQRLGGGPAHPLGAPRPSPGPCKQPPVWSRSARWCRPRTRAAGSPGSQTGWGHVLSGTRAGLGVPPPAQGPGVRCGEGTPGPRAELGVHRHPGGAAWTPLSPGAASSGQLSLYWGRGRGEGRRVRCSGEPLTPTAGSALLFCLRTLTLPPAPDREPQAPFLSSVKARPMCPFLLALMRSTAPEVGI